MKKSKLLNCLLISASLPLFAGCVEREVVYRDRPVPAPPPGGPPTAEVVPAAPPTAEVAPVPPPAQVEVVPAAPGPLDVWLWVPGCYEWRGGWVWVGGHWNRRPYRGAVWIGGHWGYHGHRRIWIGAGWR